MAESYCVQHGGHLVSIHSPEEEEFIQGSYICFKKLKIRKIKKIKFDKAFFKFAKISQI